MAQHDTKWENTINEASELYQRIAELEAENARLRDAATDLSDVVDNAGLHAMFARQIDALRAALGGAK